MLAHVLENSALRNKRQPDAMDGFTPVSKIYEKSALRIADHLPTIKLMQIIALLFRQLYALEQTASDILCNGLKFMVQALCLEKTIRKAYKKALKLARA